MIFEHGLAQVHSGRAFVISHLPKFDECFVLAADGSHTLFSEIAPTAALMVDGENLIVDGTFEAGVECWLSEQGLPAEVFMSTDFSETTRLAGLTTAYVTGRPETFPFSLTYNDPIFGQGIPVIPGETYHFQGLFAAHRALGSIEVEFVDEQQNVISAFSTNINEGEGGPNRQDCQSVDLVVSAPPCSRCARLSIRFVRSLNAVRGMNFFLFFTDLKFALSKSDAIWGERNAPEGWTRALLSIVSTSTPARLFCAKFDAASIKPSSPIISLAPLSRGEHREVSLYDVRSVLNQASAQIHFERGRLLAVKLVGTENCTIFYDGEIADRASYRRTGDGFIVELPEEMLDGTAHFFEVRDSAGIATLARDYFLVPYASTPWRVLQEHSSPHPPFYLAPAAAHRYLALQEHLESGVDGFKSEQLAHAHRAVCLGFEANSDFRELTFPSIDSPDVSIVIPVHNKFEVTYFCLCALLLARNKATFEVIIVDDGSSDRTMSLGRIATNCTVLRNETPLGFIGACNRGAEAAKGTFVAFLNNDTEPTVGWLDALVEVFTIFDGVGLAGSKLIYPDGTLQEAGGIVWRNGNPWNYGRDQNQHAPQYNYTRDADYLSGASLLIPSTVWKQVGGFSTEFKPAYFEDVDLAFKVRQIGLRTLFVPSSVVYHFEGLTSGRDVTSGAKRSQEVNRPKFKSKWVDAYRGHGKEGDRPDLEKDRGIHGRVLFIDYQTPRIDADAGSYAAVQEMRLVQALGYKVSFFPHNAAYLGRHTEYLQKLGIETYHAPFFQSVDEVLERHGTEIDAVYMIRYYVVQGCFDAIKRYAPQAKLIMNNCDLHFLRELRAGIVANDDAKIKNAVVTRDQELATMRQVDLTLSYNEVEHAVIMSHNLAGSRVMRAPWVEKITEPSVNNIGRSGIAFLGGFNHPPNKEAVQFFVDKVMPILRDSSPGVEFNIYGSNVPSDVSSLAGEDVFVRGYVRDVKTAYDSCCVFVAPLTSGAGVKGKVLGALAHGAPCVLSPVAAEGIGLRDGYDCFIAKTPIEWAKAIELLLKDKELAAVFAQRGRELIRRNYSFSAGILAMREAFEALELYTPPRQSSSYPVNRNLIEVS